MFELLLDLDISEFRLSLDLLEKSKLSDILDNIDFIELVVSDDILYIKDICYILSLNLLSY